MHIPTFTRFVTLVELADALVKLIKPTDRIVISKTVLTRVATVSPEGHRGDKPNGLWYGIGTSWVDWCREEMPNWISGDQHVYRLTLNESSVLRLTTPKALDQFTADYGFDDGRKIDWKRVGAKYKGVEIAPYQWSRRRTLNWYYTWDVASGAIWDGSAVTKIAELK